MASRESNFITKKWLWVRRERESRRSLLGPLPRKAALNQALGAPGTAPASWQTVASNEPSRCSALQFAGSGGLA